MSGLVAAAGDRTPIYRRSSMRVCYIKIHIPTETLHHRMSQAGMPPTRMVPYRHLHPKPDPAPLVYARRIGGHSPPYETERHARLICSIRRATIVGVVWSELRVGSAGDEEGGNPKMVEASSQPNSVKTCICPWWLMSLSALVEPLRRMFWPAARILQPLVEAGQTCLDIGCGMGFFTVPLAQFVGATGRVAAVDIQSKMLEGAARRAKRHGVTGRISFYRPEDPEWATPQKYDFILVFWMLHEVPDQRSLLETLHRALKTSGCILLVEPRLHVGKPQWEESLAWAKAVHLEPRVGPPVALSRTAILQPRVGG